MRMTDKYRWHDLLANPEELPDDRVVLVFDGVDYGTAYYQRHGYIGWVTSDKDLDYEEIIAWRYFEPFGGEEA